MEEAKTNGSSILIVDDNPKNLQVLAKLLQVENYEIEFAISGKVALEWLESKLFDIILLDINMPEMDGYEVCKKIRATSELDKVPVIFLSAESDRDSILKGFELGAQDYITKPFDSRELIARVKTHLALKSSQEELLELNKTLENKVTERTLQLKKANQELELLDDAKTEFLNMLSHEIRTPLNGIKGFLGLLKENIQSEKLIKYLDYLDESSNRLERFAQTAYIITSLKSKQRKLEISQVPLHHLLSYTVNDLMQIHSDKQINIEIDCENKDLKIDGDFELIKMSITQIIENSIIHADKAIDIEVKVVENQDNMALIVQDNGNGFTEKALESLFHPFSAGQQHIDKKVGLGLYMVKLVADSHNAIIEVGNNENKGAFVKLIFKKVLVNAVLN